MLHEHTTLASVARLIGETLQRDYGIDPAPLFAKASIDTDKFVKPGARMIHGKTDELWTSAVELTGDRWFGLKAGARAEPGDFYVLGHAWLSSRTLHDAFQRLVRYANVVSTAYTDLRIESSDGKIALIERFPDATVSPNRVADEAGYVAFFKLCDLLARRTVRPISVELVFPRGDAASVYEKLFQCPVSFGHDVEVFLYEAEECEEHLPGYIPEVLDSTSRIAAEYLRDVDQGGVTTAVRRELVQAIPSGNVNQDLIARRLYRSRSTLQRQLAAEGTTYSEILRTTRQSLAQRYLADGSHTQAEVAYMTGFSDQSNFARAFKRWTGMSPGEFRNAAA